MKKLIKFYLKLLLLPFILVEKMINKKIVWRIINIAKETYPQKVIIDNIYFSADEHKIASRGLGVKTKEPDTIYWIDNYIKNNETLYDIGANVGVFSLYAAKKVRGIKIYSFEPESSNYYYLNKNIYLNKFDSKIIALNIALNDEKLISYLNLSEFVAGSALHNFHEEVDQYHKSFKPLFRQGVLGISLDELIFDYGLEKPNHVKMDVDGNEYKIINGMKKILKDTTLKTIAIELNQNLETDKNVIRIILEAGFNQLNGNKNLVNQRYKKKGWPYNLYFERQID